MADKELKIEGTFSEKQLEALFGELAGLLEGISEVKLPGLRRTLATSSKARISLKRQADGVLLKAKVKTEAGALKPKKRARRAPGTAAKSQRPRYKALKKRMDKTFASIGKSLKAGNLPTKQIVQSYLQDSELMITYPKKGNEHYEAYKGACLAFQTAFEQGKLPAVRRAYKVFDTLMEACHDAYK